MVNVFVSLAKMAVIVDVYGLGLFNHGCFMYCTFYPSHGHSQHSSHVDDDDDDPFPWTENWLYHTLPNVALGMQYIFKRLIISVIPSD